MYRENVWRINVLTAQCFYYQMLVILVCSSVELCFRFCHTEIVIIMQVWIVAHTILRTKWEYYILSETLKLSLMYKFNTNLI